MATKSAYLRFRVTDEEKTQFEQLCKGKDLSPSDVLREYVQAELSADTEEIAKEDTQDSEASESRWKVVNTRLTQSEYRGLITGVQAENTTVSKWLLRLIREQIIDAPQLRAEELQVITQALFRLQSVGRNLNQLVKHLHCVPTSQASIDTSELMALKDSIQETTQAITSLIKSASARDFEYV